MGEVDKLKRIRLGSGILPSMVDTRQLSELTGMPAQTIWRACRNGDIPFYRMGRSLRYDAEEILGLIRQDSTEAISDEPSWEDKLEDYELLNFVVDEDWSEH